VGSWNVQHSADVNDHTLVESWDGVTWSVVPSPNPGALGTPNDLYGVSCISANSCTAVGSVLTNRNYTTLIEFWNGLSWSTMQSQVVNGQLKDVSCQTAVFCTAVGTVIESWNGATWSVAKGAPVPSGVLGGVSCLSVSSCVAVGGVDGAVLVESWNGKLWSPVVSANKLGDVDGLNQVSCVWSSCTGVGSYSKTEATGFVSPAHTLIERGGP
jgi:hypothetical protein